jgi:hypothetical protein
MELCLKRFSFELVLISTLLNFQSYCQKHSLNQKRRDSDDSDDEKGKKKHMTAEERSLAKRQK